jgi:hypothetical protein
VVGRYDIQLLGCQAMQQENGSKSSDSSRKYQTFHACCTSMESKIFAIMHDRVMQCVS